MKNLLNIMRKHKARSALIVILMLVAGRYMEPIVEDWLEDKSCEIGSVSKEQYEKIRQKAATLYKNSRQMTFVDPETKQSKTVAWNPYRYPHQAAVHLKKKMELFIPKDGSLDEQIAHGHALMRAFGGRPYKFHPSANDSETFGFRYLFYGGRHFSFLCLFTCTLPSARYQAYGFVVNKSGYKRSSNYRNVRFGFLGWLALSYDVRDDRSIGCPKMEWIENLEDPS